jgi:hypothetical protein
MGPTSSSFLSAAPKLTVTFPETPFITVGTRMNLSGVTVNTDAPIGSDTFQAIITGIVDWGDGTTSPISFSSDFDGTTSTEMSNVSSATIVAGHTYESSGSGLFVITITLSTEGAPDVSAAINALVE